MNFVGLVGQLQQEVGVIGAAPTTLAGQVAEVNRLAGWVNAAWLDIQQAHEDWFFLRAKFSFATQPQVWTYGESQVGIGAPGLGRYKLDSLRLYNPALGVASEMRLPHLDYDRFLGQFQ